MGDGFGIHRRFPLFHSILLPIVFALIAVPTLGAQSIPSTAPSDEEEWRIGVAVFEPLDLPDEYLYLIRSIPGTVLNLLQSLETHYLDEEEIEGRKRRILEEAVEESLKELAEAREEAAELIFLNEDDPKQKEETRRQLERRMADLEAELAVLEEFDRGKIEIPPRQDLETVLPSGGGLLEEDSSGPEGISLERNLDMFIYGRVEEIEGVIFFETRVWNSALGRDEGVIQKAATPESLNGKIDEMLRELKEIVYGRPWAELIVEPTPKVAEIYLDGVFLGTGIVEAETLEPGGYTLEVRGPGHKPESRTLFLGPSARKRVSVTLEPRAEEDLLIRTRPGGADVYLDALWVGTTPLTLPRPPEVAQLILKKESFAPRMFKIDETYTGEVTVDLAPILLDKEAYIEKKRDVFYRTAGLFVLSFPIPFFLYTMSIDFAAGYAAAAVSGNTSEAERMRNLSNGFYHGFWGGVVISVSLLAHTIYTLIDYIQAADSSR